MLLKVFHLTVIVVYLYTLWYDQVYVNLPLPAKEFEVMPFKARLAFLTVWCLLLQTLYFALSLLNDFTSTNDAPAQTVTLIRKIKDTIFSTAVPVTLYVTVMFWTMITIDKDLLLPKKMKSYPIWVNHVIHTSNTLFIFIELFVGKINYPSRKLGISIMLTFMVIYNVWQHVLYFKFGAWMYPFLNINGTVRALFFAFSGVYTLSTYLLGEKLNYWVSRKRAAYTIGKNDVRKKNN